MQRWLTMTILAILPGTLDSGAALKVGVTAPDFSGKTHDAKPFRLSALRGKVVIVDFWGPG